MAFVQRPRLAGHLTWHVPRTPNHDEVIVLTGREPVFLKRRLFDLLRPLLDGSHSLDAISIALRGQVDVAELVAAIQMLARQGAVEEATAPDRPAFRTASVLQMGRIATADQLCDAMEVAGITVTESAEADVKIVLVDHYLHPDLPAIAAEQVGSWMIARPCGEHMWIGPLFRPGQGACMECLAQRLRHNHKIDLFVAHESGALPTADADNGVSSGARAAMYAMIAQLLANGDDTLENTVLTLNPLDLSMQRHIVVRRPQCPACGQPTSDDTAPPKLVAPDTAPSDRDAAARETLERYDHHISPITGLLARLEKRSKAAGLHVYRGGAYSTRQPLTMDALSLALGHHAAGKGVTDLQARASALAETLEWYSLGAQPDDVVLVETAAALSGRARIIAPPQLTHFSDAQYRDRATINTAAVQGKYHVPAPFDPDVPFGWRKIWSLSKREWAYVPGAACCSSYACPFMVGNSNGNAAGRTLWEATMHAAMEVVERDAIALWWYNFVSRRRIDPDGLNADLLDAMHTHYRRVNSQFWLLDITSDLGIPVVAALSLRNGQERGMPVMGFGADPDPHVAATRALTELNQLMPRLTDLVAREDRPIGVRHGDDLPVPPHVLGMVDAPPLKITDLTRPDFGAPAHLLDGLVAHLRGRGLELLVADLTLPDVRLPVVRALIPGLRHAYPELGPGRLHDVPLAQRWIDRPVPEARMRMLPSPL